jgi:hypothetical protein
MPHIPFHPAIGFGDLMAGWMVVPQNPIRDAGTPLVPSLQGLAAGRPVRIPHVGELMPGQFAVPQNPLRDALGMGGLGCGSCGIGYPGYGMGDVSTWLNDSTLSDSVSFPNWMILGAAGLAFLWLAPFGGKKRK